MRVVDGEALTFTAINDLLVDDQTGSTWSPENGLALDGEMQGRFLTAIHYTPAFDWSRRDFYPAARFYPEYRGR